MDVILLERIKKLGQMGDVVSVKHGYARNYLLPQNKAVTASDENKVHFESQLAQLEAQNLEQKSEAEAVGEKMDGTLVVMVRQAGDAGQLYGSVNARDIANGLVDASYTVNRNQVSLSEPIKSIGLHDVTVSLHPEVSVTVTANVARSEEEAKIQEQTGEAVVSTEEEEPSLVEEALAEAEVEDALVEAAADEDEAADDAESSEETEPEPEDSGEGEEAPAEESDEEQKA